MTTFVAHSGNPPIAFYLLPRGLPKTVYAGTLMAFFTISNTAKLGLYIWLRGHDPAILWKVAVLPAGSAARRVARAISARPYHRAAALSDVLSAGHGHRPKLLYDSLLSSPT